MKPSIYLILSLLIIAQPSWAHVKLEHRHQSSFESVIKPVMRHAEKTFKSKREVMRSVKQRYQAQVLKIRLNERQQVYKVRILLPNGKVKSVIVDALR